MSIVIRSSTARPFSSVLWDWKLSLSDGVRIGLQEEMTSPPAGTAAWKYHHGSADAETIVWNSLEQNHKNESASVGYEMDLSSLSYQSHKRSAWHPVA